MDGFKAARETDGRPESWAPGPRTIGLFTLKKIPAPRFFYGTPFALLQIRELRTANYVSACRSSLVTQPKSIGLSSIPEPEEYKPGPAGQAISLCDSHQSLKQIIATKLSQHSGWWN
jgi:hypothetical protein